MTYKLVHNQNDIFSFSESLKTILIAVFIFVFGQIAQNFIFENIKKYKEIKGKIHYQLFYYLEELSCLGKLKTGSDSKAINKNLLEARLSIRELTSELSSSYSAIPFKELFYVFRIIPSRSEMSNVIQKLIIFSDLLKTSGLSEIELLNFGLSKKQLKLIKEKKLLYEDVLNDIKDICTCLNIDYQSLQEAFKNKMDGMKIIPSFVD